MDRAPRFTFDFQSFAQFAQPANGIVDTPSLAQVGLAVFQGLGLVEPEPGLKLAELIGTEFTKSRLVGRLKEALDACA